jgi:ring-1,2-phenylacetyl-CoA epoxidase subunit PaaD
MVITDHSDLRPLGTNGIWGVLSEVPDPEVPAVSIVDLGIVRDVTPDRVVLTPTYTGCPATQVIETMVRIALDKAGFERVGIDTALSPPWTTDWITEEGRAKLKAYGIAPPQPAGSRAVGCPQCGSADTQEVSRFGSTPCKALWKCRACLEPFDLFKCH